MGYNNGLISGNVTVPDVQKALGTSETRVSELCKHGSINRYTRHKPYAFGGILADGLYGKNGTDDTKIIANNFGMTSGEIVWPTLLADRQNFQICLKPWAQWRPPSGKPAATSPSKVDEPRRLGDFRGYNTKHVTPILKYDLTSVPSSGTSTMLPYLTLANGCTTLVNIAFKQVSLCGILPEEFKTVDGDKLSDMRLTLVVLSYNPNNSAKIWGEKMLIVQSAKTLEQMRTSTSSGTAGFYAKVGLKYSDTTHGAIKMNDDGMCFFALGFAKPINNSKVATGENAVPSILNANELTLPKLIPIDVWNDLSEPAKFVNFGQIFALNFEYLYPKLCCAVQSRIVTDPYKKLKARYGTKGGVNGIYVTIEDEFNIQTAVTTQTGLTEYITQDAMNTVRIGVMYQINLYSDADSEFYFYYPMFATRKGIHPGNDAATGVVYENRIITVNGSGISGKSENADGKDPMKDYDNYPNGVKVVTTSDMVNVAATNYANIHGAESFAGVNWMSMDSGEIFIPTDDKTMRVTLVSRELIAFSEASGQIVYIPEITQHPTSNTQWNAANAPIVCKFKYESSDPYITPTQS